MQSEPNPPLNSSQNTLQALQKYENRGKERSFLVLRKRDGEVFLEAVDRGIKSWFTNPLDRLAFSLKHLFPKWTKNYQFQAIQRHIQEIKGPNSQQITKLFNSIFPRTKLSESLAKYTAVVPKNTQPGTATTPESKNIHRNNDLSLSKQNAGGSPAITPQVVISPKTTPVDRDEDQVVPKNVAGGKNSAITLQVEKSPKTTLATRPEDKIASETPVIDITMLDDDAIESSIAISQIEKSPKTALASTPEDKAIQFYKTHPHQTLCCGIQNWVNNRCLDRCYLNATLKALFACPEFRDRVNNFSVDQTLYLYLIENKLFDDAQLVDSRDKALKNCVEKLRLLFDVLDRSSSTSQAISQGVAENPSEIDLFVTSFSELMRAQNEVNKGLTKAGYNISELPGIEGSFKFEINKYKQQDVSELFQQLVGVIWNTNREFLVSIEETSGVVDGNSHVDRGALPYVIFRRNDEKYDSLQNKFEYDYSEENPIDDQHGISIRYSRAVLTGPQAPDLLPIQIARFRENQEKDQRQIEIPLVLEVPYLNERGEEKQLYALRAITIHSGASTKSGHYFTYTPDPSQIKNQFYTNKKSGKKTEELVCENWVEHNDATVKKVKWRDINTIISENAYMVYYERVKE